MERVGSVEKQQLHHCQMSTSTSQRERGVVIVGSLPAETNCITINPNKDAAILILPVNISAFRDEKLDGAEMAGSSGLHEWSTASFRRMFQVGAILQQQFSHVCVAVFASVSQRRVSCSRLGVNVSTGF